MYYKLGHAFVTNWGALFYYKLRQTLSQNWGGFVITNWGKLGQNLLQIGGCITN